MKYFIIFLLIIIGGMCREPKVNNDEQNPKLKDYSSLGNTNYFDSLFINIDCIDDTEWSDNRITILQDSINSYYEQIIIRLKKIEHEKKLKDFPFLKRIVASKESYQNIIDTDSDIIFYSFGNATAQGFYAKCYKIRILEQRLLFIKASFENAYWNYDFDEIK